MDMQQASTQVAEYIRTAIDYISQGFTPDAALANAETDTGITQDAFDSADMGQSLDYLCTMDGLSPEYQSYFDAVSQSYASSGSVAVGGGAAASASASASASAASAGSAAAASASASASASTIVNNYTTYVSNEYDVDHTDIDVNAFGSNVDIDVDQSDTDVDGDGNVVTQGEGNLVNAATGEGSSAAQALGGDAVSNTGNEAITGATQLGQFNTGDGSAQVVGAENQVVTGDVTGVLTDDGDVQDVSTVGGDNFGVSIGDQNDSAVAFGGGDASNISNVQDAQVAQGPGATSNINTGDNVQQAGAFGDNDALQVNLEAAEEHDGGDEPVLLSQEDAGFAGPTDPAFATQDATPAPTGGPSGGEDVLDG